MKRITILPALYCAVALGAPHDTHALDTASEYVYLKCQGAAPGYRIDMTNLSLREWSKESAQWSEWTTISGMEPSYDETAQPEVAKDTPNAFIFTRYDKKGAIDGIATVDRRTLTVSIQGFVQRPKESHCLLAKQADFKMIAPRF